MTSKLRASNRDSTALRSYIEDEMGLLRARNVFESPALQRRGVGLGTSWVNTPRGMVRPVARVRILHR